VDAKPGAITLEDLIDELARVIYEPESARVLVLRARFPAADLPVFDVPQVFWSRVIRAAADGKLVGGVRAVVDAAAKRYPGNLVFAGYRAQEVATSQGDAPGSSGPERPLHSTPATTSSAQQATHGRTQIPGTSAGAPEGYDVFLSHSSADKPAVETIAVRLRDEAGLRPFLDKWHLVPGESWMPALERAIERSTTVAVFFGPQGRGVWHDQESQLALVLAAEEHGKRVIPVLLPGARKADVGGFMRLRTWVELGEPDGFERLVAGITGRPPGPGDGRAGVGVEPRPVEPSRSPVSPERPRHLERAGIDNRRASIGQQIIVQGNATFEGITVSPPASNESPSSRDGRDAPRIGSPELGPERASEAKDVTPVVVLALANDRAVGGRPLRNLPAERRAIQQQLTARAEVRVVPDALLEEVWDVFGDESIEGRVQVFHFAGHASGSWLAFENEAGAPVNAHAEGLAGFLGRQDGLVLVFLNGCSTLPQVRRLRQGVRAVVATTDAILDEAAAELAGRFYAGLRSKPLERAFLDAVDFMKAKYGGDPRGVIRRELVHEDDDESVGWPWVLDCDDACKQWRLGQVPPASVKAKDRTASPQAGAATTVESGYMPASADDEFTKYLEKWLRRPEMTWPQVFSALCGDDPAKAPQNLQRYGSTEWKAANPQLAFMLRCFREDVWSRWERVKQKSPDGEIKIRPNEVFGWVRHAKHELPPHVMRAAHAAKLRAVTATDEELAADKADMDALLNEVRRKQGLI